MKSGVRLKEITNSPYLLISSPLEGEDKGGGISKRRDDDAARDVLDVTQSRKISISKLSPMRTRGGLVLPVADMVKPLAVSPVHP